MRHGFAQAIEEHAELAVAPLADETVAFVHATLFAHAVARDAGFAERIRLPVLLEFDEGEIIGKRLARGGCTFENMTLDRAGQFRPPGRPDCIDDRPFVVRRITRRDRTIEHIPALLRSLGAGGRARIKRAIRHIALRMEQGIGDDDEHDCGDHGATQQPHAKPQIAPQPRHDRDGDRSGGSQSAGPILPHDRLPATA